MSSLRCSRRLRPLCSPDDPTVPICTIRAACCTPPPAHNRPHVERVAALPVGSMRVSSAPMQRRFTPRPPLGVSRKPSWPALDGSPPLPVAPPPPPRARVTGPSSPARRVPPPILSLSSLPTASASRHPASTDAKSGRAASAGGGERCGDGSGRGSRRRPVRQATRRRASDVNCCLWTYQRLALNNQPNLEIGIPVLAGELAESGWSGHDS